MIAVMVMTPLHMHHGGATLEVIGIVISAHVLGMFALAPVVGWAADKYGRPPVLMTGAGVLFLALFLSGTSPAGASTQIGDWMCSHEPEDATYVGSNGKLVVYSVFTGGLWW